MAADDPASGRLIDDCAAVRVRINWFSTSAQVDKKTAETMLEGTNAQRGSVSISKRLMQSKHKALADIREVRREIELHVRAWTIPLLVLTQATDDEVARKDAGRRLIQKKDMEQFDRQMQELAKQLKLAGTALQTAMPEIQEADRLKHGQLFDPADYPTDVMNSVGVEVSYSSVGVDVDWQTVCPEIYRREAENARRMVEQVVDHAAAEFIQGFVQCVQRTAQQLGVRTRLNPTANGRQQLIRGHAVDLMDMEVLSAITHEIDSEVPDGQILLEVRDDRPGAPAVWLDHPLDLHYYRTCLRPYETTERRKLFDSTIETLQAQLEAFTNIGQMLGDHRQPIEEATASLRSLLARAASGRTTAELADRLRREAFLRDQLREALTAIPYKIREATTIEPRSRRRVRREAVLGFEPTETTNGPQAPGEQAQPVAEIQSL